jgi:hypothetical protein
MRLPAIRTSGRRLIVRTTVDARAKGLTTRRWYESTIPPIVPLHRRPPMPEDPRSCGDHGVVGLIKETRVRVGTGFCRRGVVA